MIKYLYFLILMIIPLHFFAQQKTGIASFYHAKFSGKKTASGDIFSNQKMTGASNHFRLGEWVKVTNVHNGKIVYVLINDRMAKNSARLIDLTRWRQKASTLCIRDFVRSRLNDVRNRKICLKRSPMPLRIRHLLRPSQRQTSCADNNSLPR